MNIVEQVKRCVRTYTRIWNIDVVIYEDDGLKSYCRPIIELHFGDVESQKIIFGTAAEMKQLLEHYRNCTEYKIDKYCCRGAHGQNCYSIRPKGKIRTPLQEKHRAAPPYLA